MNDGDPKPPSGAEDHGGVGVLSRAIAIVVVAPSLLHLIGRDGAGWYFVAAGLVLPWLVGARSGGSESRRAGRVLAFATGAALVVPMLPTLVELFGFSLERVFFSGALSWLLWHGLLTPRSSASGVVLSLRSILLGWAAWSTGSALHAAWLATPASAPWLSESLRAVLLDPFGARSMVDPTYPLVRLAQRLEMLLLAWAALEVALRDRDLPRRIAFALAVALPGGVLVNAYAVLVGFRGSAMPIATRASSFLDRVYRPLPDRNALGTALVLAIPLACWWLWRSLKTQDAAAPPRQKPIALIAVASGLLLLVLSGSKSAILGFGVALVAFVVLWSLYARGRVRRLVLAALAIGSLLPIGVQLLPEATVGQMMEVRYLRDGVRALRFDFAQNYLVENRYALWSSATAMIADEPMTGVGLGRFASTLPRYHDPDAGGSFNPYQENAHNQYLQWAAEEGFVGAGLGIAFLLLALFSGARAMRAAELDGHDQPERLGLCVFTAGLAGVAFNLLVGHALLVPAVAGVVAVCVGLVVAGASRALAASAESRAWPRFAAAWLLFIPLGAAPALIKARAPLETYQVGCFPWLWQPETDSAPVFSRLLGPDARWIERWGNGSRMLMLAKSITAPEVGEEQHLDVYVNGELVLESYRLPRRTPDQPLNPIVVLKLDAPPGVKSGDLVELRVVCDPPYAESVSGGFSQAVWGPRVWAPTFTTPGRR